VASRASLPLRAFFRPHAVGFASFGLGIDLQGRDRTLLGNLIAVRADHHLVPAIEGALEPIGRFADLLLWKTLL
jgi:hypothetical protein